MSAVQVRDGLPIDQMPEWLGSALQKRRCRFNSGSGLQAPVARAERHRSSKSAHAGSNPAWSSTVHGRVAQRMSADFLHRRMHVRIVSRSPTWRVNWAGAQRRLLSDRPAQPGENRALNSPPNSRAWRTGVRAWLPTKTCEFDSHCPHQADLRLAA